MSTTTAVPCPAGEWTPVATGSSQVTTQATNGATNNIGSYYLGVGSAPPAAVADAPIVSSASGEAVLSGLANTDNVYIYPISGALLVRVIAS